LRVARILEEWRGAAREVCRMGKEVEVMTRRSMWPGREKDESGEDEGEESARGEKESKT